MKMTYEDAMKYISSVGKFGSNYGLNRTFRLLELLGNPQKKLKLIHIAGTNGKGSTSAMLNKMLIDEGYKTGMYTSPYLEEFEERIQINSKNIPKDILVELLEEVKIAVDKVIEEKYEHPTEFEILTVLMLLYFYNEKIDYGIIETGLGGRLDSTNVIRPILSVITSISMDHMNILGNTIDKIAREKAGIIKEGKPVILYPQSRNVEEIIMETAKNKKSKIIVLNKEDSKIDEINKKENYQRITIKTENKKYNIKLPLLGAHQVLNASVAVNCMEVLLRMQNIRISAKKIEKSLEDVVWKGRLEVLYKSPLVVIDGAHNIDGIRALKMNIKDYFEYDRMYLLLGILADKQVHEMIEEIAPIANEIIALTPHSERAELCEDLKNEIKKCNENVVAIEDYKEAFLTAINEAKENDIIIISGSLYMVGDMRKIINEYYRNSL